MGFKLLIDELKNYEGKNVFNPYSDICSVYDKSDAVEIRVKNLKKIIKSLMASRVDSIWIGRDLGHRGGRRTGVALTDEVHLDCASRYWGASLSKATVGVSMPERTAANIWDNLMGVDEKVFTWNVFPFHPHEPGNQFSNRSHTAKERDDGIKILEIVISILKPNKIIAIGNDAFECAKMLSSNIKIHKVRHPSYGGERDFYSQVGRLYRIRKFNGSLV